MNTRIKIYGILLTFIYVGIYVNMIYYDGENIKESFMDGMNSHKDEKEGLITAYALLKPANASNSVETVYNKTSGENIEIRTSSYKTKTTAPIQSIPTYLFVFKIIFIIVAVFLVLGLFAFPFIFLNVIYNITKNKIISESTTLKTRILGWILISFFIINSLAEILEAETAKHLVDINDYEVVYPNFETSLICLCLGIVTLLLAEMLKTSLVMKEEQDLTI